MRAYYIMTSLVIRAAVSAASLTNLSVNVPSVEPPWSVQLDPNLVGFSLEFQFWPLYGGTSVKKPNQYVNQLLDNLGQRTGVPPAIRIGGTSENTALIDLNLRLFNHSQLSEPLGPFDETTRSITQIGRDWYVLAGNLPDGTVLTWGLPLYNKTEAVAQAKMIQEAFQGSRAALTQNVTLGYIEVGNEPNLYIDDPVTYVESWEESTLAVIDTIDFGNDGPLLAVGSEGEPVYYSGASTPTWDIIGALEAGMIDNLSIRRLTGNLNAHHYSGFGFTGTPPSPPPGTLMSKPNIRGNFSNIMPGIQAAAGYDIPFWLGEASTYSVEGVYGLSNTAESAIWSVDFTLQAASVGIQRVYFHNTPNRLFSSFMPTAGWPNGTGIADRAHIMPMYNGLLVVAEMVGTSDDARIAEIQVRNANVSSYGVWEEGSLARMAVINAAVYDKNRGARDVVNITLSGSDREIAGVKRLKIPHITVTEGITWAGQSFETLSGAPSGPLVEEAPTGNSFILAASEVILLDFK